MDYSTRVAFLKAIYKYGKINCEKYSRNEKGLKISLKY